MQLYCCQTQTTSSTHLCLSLIFHNKPLALAKNAFVHFSGLACTMVSVQFSPPLNQDKGKLKENTKRLQDSN